MKTARNYSRLFIFLILLYTILNTDRNIEAAEPAGKIENPAPPVARPSEGPETHGKILVELFLARERKGDLEAIKKELEAAGITRIRPQFFRLGNPPENIAIGKNIPADVARLAIRLAITYNRDIKSLLPEYRFFPDHIVIGSSAFDEKSEIPIQPEDLKRLSDPALTTAQFHELYRRLTGEDKRNPTYLE
ncbi:MAG: hypothetical protein HY349_07810 [Nitrospirae bacterium]|nr:hypothetical protein [Nitrospirota bacterium]